MMKQFVAPMAAAMLLAGAAFAQGASSGAAGGSTGGSSAGDMGASTTSRSQTSSTMSSATGQLTSDHLMDMKVVTPQGDKVGDIKNLVINPQNGQVSEVVVSVGGFLGIGDKKVALPWNQVQINQENKQLVTPATKEQLEQAQAWHDPTEQQARTPESRPTGAGSAPPPGSAAPGGAGNR